MFPNPPSFPETVNFSGRNYVSSKIQFYRVKHDSPLWRFNLPEVFRLNPDHHVVLTEEIQWLIRRINPTLTVSQFTALLDNKTALANGTGFPGHANYIAGKDLDKPDPRFDQARVFGGAILKGTEVNGNLIIDAIDTRKPLPTVKQILASPWLFCEAVNIGSSPSGAVVRPFKGAWNKKVYVPNLVSRQVSYPLALLRKLPLGTILPSPYLYP